jgi:glycosyltransferase involved in cell wall biosynthesis
MNLGGTMNIVFIHQNFPGQYRHLVRQFLADPANRIVGICQPQAPGIRNKVFVQVLRSVYKPHREPAKTTHPYLANVERNVLNGQGVARVLLNLQKKGFKPDIAFAHIGWGEALYFKDIFPDVPLIGYCEFYYHGQGADLGFDPEFPASMDDRMRVRTWNATQLVSLASCDICVSPTQWQKSLYPAEFQNKIRVVHEGIDTVLVKPDPAATLILPDRTTLTKDMEVITYTARGLEPYRGFHIFMKAAEEICRRRPRCHIVITGGNEARYGKRLPGNQTWRAKLLKEVKLDPARVHFMGYVPYETHLNTLQISSAHVYLTVPFVLSWSMLEAMAAGCVVIGSKTPPVEEFIEDGRNGLLVDFFSPQKIADRVDGVLDHPDRMSHLGQAARQDIIKNYEVKKKLVDHQELYTSLLIQNKILHAP